MVVGIMSVNLPACAILGAGTMGAQIALSLALGGASVALWGRRSENLAPALDRIGVAYDGLAAEGLGDAADRDIILARISTTSELAQAVSDAGFVIEAVAEDITVKQDLLAQAEAHTRRDTILSSTTSALSPTEIQLPLKRPEKFCVAHYAQPAHLVELVEIVPGSQTDPETTQMVTDLMNTTGKYPVLCPDIPGFLWARIQHAVLREFASLVGKGVVTPEACDQILKVGYASRLPAMGAFEHADLAGLGLMNGNAAKAVWADLSNVSDPAETPVGKLYERGLGGMATGKGFYDWTVRNADAFKAERDAEIIRRIKLRNGGRVVG